MVGHLLFHKLDGKEGYCTRMWASFAKKEYIMSKDKSIEF